MRNPFGLIRKHLPNWSLKEAPEEREASFLEVERGVCSPLPRREDGPAGSESDEAVQLLQNPPNAPKMDEALDLPP